RPAGAWRNSCRETSYILPTWLQYEFKGFCRGRRILFCGAEASLLKVLLGKELFLAESERYLDASATTFFLQPRNDGKDLADNLDLIKEDLTEATCRLKIDTVFLSLGGAAKILCFELARDLGICAIDFGVGLRSLTYSGSDGNLAARSTHLVF